MISQIPLIGLTNKIDVQSIARSQNEFAEIVAGTTTQIYKKLACRISLFLENESVDNVLLQGRDLKRTFKVICKYSPRITENIQVVVPINQPAPNGTYDIFYVKHEQDNTGAWHHTKIYMEKV